MSTSLYQEVIPPYTRRFYLLIPGGNTSLYQEVIYNSKYYPCGLERLSILDLHCRFGLIGGQVEMRQSRIQKRDEENSTKKKQAISKLNQAIYMVRYRIRLLLLRAKLTLGLDAFDCLTCLTFLKLRA